MWHDASPFARSNEIGEGPRPRPLGLLHDLSSDEQRRLEIALMLKCFLGRRRHAGVRYEMMFDALSNETRWESLVRSGTAREWMEAVEVLRQQSEGESVSGRSQPEREAQMSGAAR